jgi:hypothetical protein
MIGSINFIILLHCSVYHYYVLRPYFEYGNQKLFERIFKILHPHKNENIQENEKVRNRQDFLFALQA